MLLLLLQDYEAPKPSASILSHNTVISTSTTENHSSTESAPVNPFKATSNYQVCQPAELARAVLCSAPDHQGSSASLEGMQHAMIITVCHTWLLSSAVLPSMMKTQHCLA